MAHRNPPRIPRARTTATAAAAATLVAVFAAALLASTHVDSVAAMPRSLVAAGVQAQAAVLHSARRGSPSVDGLVRPGWRARHAGSAAIPWLDNATSLSLSTHLLAAQGARSVLELE